MGARKLSLECGAAALVAMQLSGLCALLGAFDEPLDRLASVPHAGTDFHEIGRLSEKPAPSYRRDGNLQKFGDLVLGQKCFKLDVRVCHTVLSRWLTCPRDSRNAMSRIAGIKRKEMQETQELREEVRLLGWWSLAHHTANSRIIARSVFA
jgi:hypothetical protein